MKRFMRIHPSDNIIVALTDLKKGEEIALDDVFFPLAENIPQKQKFTVTSLAPGDTLRMYGVLVGRVVKPIPQGGLVSTANVEHASSDFQGRHGEFRWQPPDVSRWQGRTIQGYHRSDGQVGALNYWLV